MKVLVLGGCGFIGSHLVDALLGAGHQVRVFDRALEAYRRPLQQADYRLGNFLDSALLAEALEGVDIVYHLISTTVPSTSNLNPIADVESNLVGTLHLLNLMVQKKIPKIVYLSSGGTVYGIPQTVPIAETHPLNPICSYGVVKVAIENYLQMFHHLYGLRYIILRVSNPYGERQGHVGVQGAVATFMRKILTNETIEIWGDGSVVRDFIYVGDLVELCVKVGGGEINGIFNAGSGKGSSINEVILALTSVTGQTINLAYRPRRIYDVPRVVLDVKKSTQMFSWSSSTDLVDGMRTSWQWTKSFGKPNHIGDSA